MARRLNKRMVMYLVVFGAPVLAVLGYLAYTALTGGVGGDPEEVLAQARKFREREQWQKAFIAIRKAVRLDPKNPDIRFELGQIALRQDPPSAVVARRSFERAVSLRPGFWEAQRALAELYVLVPGEALYALLEPGGGDGPPEFTTALDLPLAALQYASSRRGLWVADPEAGLQAVDEAIRLKPDDGPAHVWGALIETLRGDAEPLEPDRAPLYESAAERCRAGIARCPHTLELYRLLVQVLVKLDREDQVAGVFDEAVRNNPESAEAYLLKARYLIGENKTEEASRLLAEALRKGGENAQVHLAQAEVALRDRQLEAAKEHLVKALELDPTQELAYLRLAAVYRLENDRRTALQALAEGSRHLPDSVYLKAERADLHIDLNEPEAADALIKEVAETAPDSGALSYLRGKRALVNRQIREAVEHLSRAKEAMSRTPNREPTPMVLLLLARAYFVSGELGAARDQYRELLARRPNVTEGRRALAEIQLRLREYEDAVRDILPFVQENPGDVVMRLLLARAYLGQERPNEALVHIREALDRADSDPARLRALLLLAAVHRQRERPEEVEAALLKAKDLGHNLELVYPALVEHYRATGQPEKARAAVAEAQAALPGAMLFSGEMDPSEAERQLLERVERDPSPASKLSLAGFYAATDRQDRALALYREVLDEAEAGSPPWRRAWNRAFRLHLGADRYAEAGRLAERLRTANPEAPELDFVEPLMALAQDRYAEAVEQLRGIVERNPTSASWFLLGQVLFRQKRYEEARTALQQAVDLRPNLVQARLTLGHLHRIRGNFSGALLEAREALEFAPQSLALLELKALALAGEGDWEEAVETRRRIAELRPDDVNNLLTIARLQSAHGRSRDAEASFRAAYQLRPQDRRVIRSLADFYARTDRRQDADTLIEQFVRSNPDAPHGHLVRAEFLAQHSSVEQAEPHYRRAHQLRPDDPTPLVRLGDRYARTGRWGKAETVYKEVIERFPTNRLAQKRLADVHMLQGELDEAEAVIEKVIAAAPEDAQALVVRGRIAAHRNQRAEARQYMEQALKATPQYGEARYWLASLYTDDLIRAIETLEEIDPSDAAFEKAMMMKSSIEARRGMQRAAILTLRRLVDFRPSSVPARRMLAERYFAVEEYGSAAKVLARLARDRPEPEVLVRLGDAELSAKRYAEALRAYEQARTLRPESPSALVGEARSLVRLDRRDEAVKRIQGVMDIYTGEAWPRMALANIYEMTGQIDRAAETIANGLIDDPDWEEGYVYQAQLLVRAASVASPEIRRQLVNRALEALVRGLQKLPRSILLRTRLGALLISQDRYEEAGEALELVARDFRRHYSRLAEDLPGLRPYFDGVRNYSLVLYRLDRADEAIEWARMVWEIDPSDVGNANNLAWMLATEKGELDRAWEIIRTVLQLVPDQPQILDTAGWIAYLRQDYRRAMMYLRDSVRRGESAEARYHLGRTYEAAGRPEEARVEYQRALDLNLEGEERRDADQRLKELTAS